MIESIERMRKLVNDNLVMGLRFQMNGELNKLESEIEQELNSRAERTCRSTTDDSAWCFVCSECGKSFPRNKLHLAHNHGEINYCPNCGAKIYGYENNGAQAVLDACDLRGDA